LQNFELISVKRCQSDTGRQTATAPALPRARAPARDARRLSVWAHSHLLEAVPSRGREHSETLEVRAAPRGVLALTSRPRAVKPISLSRFFPMRARRPMSLAVPRSLESGNSFHEGAVTPLQSPGYITADVTLVRPHESRPPEPPHHHWHSRGELAFRMLPKPDKPP
jgi:hypothetical protein